jgi:hypothetical protein
VSLICQGSDTFITSSSWLNMMERWFAEIAGKAVRGSFSRVPDLIAAIEEHIEEWNRNPKLSVCTARAGDTRSSAVAAVGGNQTRLHGAPR